MKKSNKNPYSNKSNGYSSQPKIKNNKSTSLNPYSKSTNSLYDDETKVNSYTSGIKINN